MMSPIERQLDHILSCVQRSDKKVTAASRFFHRFEAFFLYGTWYNARFTRKAMRHYLYEETLTPQIGEKIKKIAHELQLKKKGLKSYGEEFDEGLIDALSSSKAEEAFIPRHRKAPSIKQLFHIHANEFGGNNKSLEGMTATSALEYLFSFLKSRERDTTYGLTKEDIDEIGSAISQSSLQKAISQAFKCKKPLLIKGGWRCFKSSHGIYYEILPDKDGETATFRFYNLGEGTQYHAQGLQKFQNRVVPYLDCKNVKRSVLLSPLFLKALNEIENYVIQVVIPHLVEKGVLLKVEYDAKDIYEGLKDLLEVDPSQVISSNEAERPMIPQKSGTCAWRSLMAFCSKKMGEKQYKRFICDIKLQSLLDAVEALRRTKKPSHTSCELIKRSLEKFCGVVLKASENHYVSEKTLFHAKYLIEKMKRHVTAAIERSPMTFTKEQNELLEKNQKKPPLPQPTHRPPLSKSPSSENKAAPLPKEILDHPDFKALFPEVNVGTLKGGGLYVFNEGKREIHVKLEGQDLILEQSREGHIYRLFPKEVFIQMSDTFKGSACLLERALPWQCLEDKSLFLLIDRERNEALYKVKKRFHSISSIEELETHLTLRPTSSLATSFDRQDFIYEWVDSKGKIQKVELPRFKLTFERQEGRFVCSQRKDFFLSSKPSLFHPLFPYSLLLENKEGKRQLLLLKLWLQKSKTFEALEPRFEVNQKEREGFDLSQGYFAYDLDGDMIIPPTKREEKFYLAYLDTALNHYSFASSLLRHDFVSYAKDAQWKQLQICRSLFNKDFKLMVASFADMREDRSHAYSDQERAILGKLMELNYVTGDNSANGIALRFYAGYLLLRDSLCYNKVVTRPFLESLLHVCTDYLLHYFNVTILKIPKEEAWAVFEIVGNEDYQKEQESKALSLELPPLIQETFTKGGSWAEKIKYKKSLKIEDVALTQLGCVVKERFYAFYAVARNPKASKREWLKKALTFASHRNDPLIDLLQLVYNDPLSFPPLPPITQRDMKEWKQSVLKTATEKSPKKVAKPLPGVVWIPPKDKVFEEKPTLKPIGTVPAFHLIAKDCFRNGSLSSSQKSDSSTASLEIPNLQKIAKELFMEESKIVINEKAYKALLQKDVKENEERLKTLEEKILSHANGKPKSALDQSKQVLTRLRGIQPYTLEELFLLFGSGDVETLKRQSPWIKVEELFNDIHEYLLYKTFEQQRERAKKLTVPACLAVCLLKERDYKTEEHPERLVDEYFENNQLFLHPVNLFQKIAKTVKSQ